MKRIQGIILDLDGTLIDSNEGRAQAWAEALGEAGYPVPFADVRLLVGCVAHEVLTRTVGFGEDTEIGRKIRDRARQIFVKRYVPRIAPHYRAIDLLARFEREGAKLGVVSVDPPEVLSPLLRLVGLDALVHRASFPPAEGLATQRDLLKTAIDKLGVPAARTAILCDGPHDIEAANKLGLTTVAVLLGGFPAASLRGASALYKDLATLLQDFDDSVFGAPVAA